MSKYDTVVEVYPCAKILKYLSPNQNTHDIFSCSSDVIMMSNKIQNEDCYIFIYGGFKIS